MAYLTSNSMKIAMIGQKGIPAKQGGVERHVEEISKRLAEAGHQVFIYSRSHYTGTLRADYKGVKLVYLPALKLKNLEAISHAALATLDVFRQNYDLVHYHGIGPGTLSFLVRFFKPKTKVIVTFHSRDRYQQKWGFLAREYLAFAEWAAARFPDATISVSEAIDRLVKETNPLKPSAYIPNGASVWNSKDSDVLAKFNLQPEEYIFSASRLVNHKGIHYLIQAYQQLETDKKLVIAGEASYTDEYVKYLRKLAAGNPNIIFTGFQGGADLAALFESAYLFVQPSESEGLSITVLEAMAYGNPVLVSDIPENLEAFSGHGYMFRDKDVNDLRLKLSLLLQNSRLIKSVGAAGQKFVMQNYHWDKIAESTAKFYGQVLNQAVSIPELKEYRKTA